jgi:hypothetical protein
MPNGQRPLEEHGTPAHGCICGLHAFRDQDAAIDYAGGLLRDLGPGAAGRITLGQVRLRGRLLTNATADPVGGGWRAARAEIETLAIPLGSRARPE